MRAHLVIVLTLAMAAAAVRAQDADALDRFLASRGLLGPTAAMSAPLPPGTPSVASENTATPAAEWNTQPAAPALSERLSQLVVAAMGALGVPYRRGGNDFEGGYDCSGFVRAVYEQNLGITLPRQAAQQAAMTHVIERDALQPGDLVFFNTQRRAYSHVGIYVGDHKFIHSPRPGAVVRIEDMRVAYWSRRFDGARRVVLVSADASTALQPAGPSALTGYKPY